MADLTEHIRENVRERYAAAARQVAEQNGEGCCGSETGCGSAVQAEKADFFGGSLYDRADTEGVPETAVSASLGCGVPTAVADLHDATRADMEQWTGCVAGALTREEFEQALTAAGLTDIEINETHRVHEYAGSAIIRARKP